MHFADDSVLLASSEQGIQHELGRFSAACDQAGMKISMKKTELLCLSTNSRQYALQVIGNALQFAAGREVQVPWGGIHE